MSNEKTEIFILPDLGEGLTEVEIRQWYIEEGSEIKAEQNLLSVETAKAVLDLPSPYAGKTIKLYAKAGQIVKVGSPLVSFQVEEKYSNKEIDTQLNLVLASKSKIQDFSKVDYNKEKNVKIIPAARLLSKQLNVDLNKIKGSGEDGCITIKDVKDYSDKIEKLNSDKELHEKIKSLNALPNNVQKEHITQADFMEPLLGARRSMATNLARSQQNMVAATLFEDAIISLKTPQNITLRLIEALIYAVKKESHLNAHFDPTELSLKVLGEVNLGLAMDLQTGLYLPVIEKVNQLTNTKILSMIEEFKTYAQEQNFPRTFLSTPSIILSNIGNVAGRYALPLVIPPSVVILAAGRLREQVVVKNGEILIANVLPLSLSFDHRAVTGVEAARFMKALIESLESS